MLVTERKIAEEMVFRARTEWALVSQNRMNQKQHTGKHQAGPRKIGHDDSLEVAGRQNLLDVEGKKIQGEDFGKFRCAGWSSWIFGSLEHQYRTRGRDSGD